MNDSGKTAARTGDGFDAVIEEVADSDALRMELRDGRYPRPVIDRIGRGPDRIEGADDPLETLDQGPDRFYAGLDRLIEQSYDDPAEIDPADGLDQVADRAAAERGYELTDTAGEPVTWSVLESDPEIPTERVLVPEDFGTLGRALADAYWDDAASSFWAPVPRIETYQQVRAERDLECADEERLVATTGPETAGIYMVVTGTTADSYDLSTEPIAGAVSRLGRFERSGGDRDG